MPKVFSIAYRLGYKFPNVALQALCPWAQIYDSLYSSIETSAPAKLVFLCVGCDLPIPATIVLFK